MADYRSMAQNPSLSFQKRPFWVASREFTFGQQRSCPHLLSYLSSIYLIASSFSCRIDSYTCMRSMKLRHFSALFVCRSSVCNFSKQRDAKSSANLLRLGCACKSSQGNCWNASTQSKWSKPLVGTPARSKCAARRWCAIYYQNLSIINQHSIETSRSFPHLPTAHSLSTHSLHLLGVSLHRGTITFAFYCFSLRDIHYSPPIFGPRPPNLLTLFCKWWLFNLRSSFSLGTRPWFYFWGSTEATVRSICCGGSMGSSGGRGSSTSQFVSLSSLNLDRFCSSCIRRNSLLRQRCSRWGRWKGYSSS